MGRRDFTQVAFDVVQRAIGNVPKAKDKRTPYQIAAAESGRTGGLKGGKARKKALSAKQRSSIAKNAAAARWNKKP